MGRTTTSMPIKVGEVEALFRYPVKSMSGEPLEVADWAGMASMVTGAWPSVGLTFAAVSHG